MGSLTLPLLAAFLVGYVLGSIPFGWLLARLAGAGDIRAIGSGNIGATNVLRTGRKGLAVATLVLDLLKATAAVGVVVWLVPTLIAGVPPGLNRLALTQSLPWAAAMGALCGHIYPVWLGFKGGKGVATYIGGLLAAHWPAAVVFVLVWLIVALATRISSLSAIAALVAVVGYIVWRDPTITVLTAVLLMTTLILYKHAANITRLIKGQEPKIGANA